MQLEENSYWLYRARHSRGYLPTLWLLSALCMGLGYLSPFLAPLLFVAWVPLLEIENHISRRKIKHKNTNWFLFNFNVFLGYNIITTWWIVNSTIVGTLLAVVLNSVFMTIPMMLFRGTKRYTTNWIGYVSFIAYWVTFEYWHMNWELSWSWLNLGNGLAHSHWLAQWYSTTGALGGTVWILTVNVFIFLALKHELKRPFINLMAGLSFVLPATFSLYLYLQPVNKADSYAEVVCLQPNIDPYTEKFTGMSTDMQLAKFIAMSSGAIKPSTDLVLWPETAIPSHIDEAAWEASPYMVQLRIWTNQMPKTALVTGANTYKSYNTRSAAGPTATFSEGIFYNFYNSALFVANGRKVEEYHKSKLVPGVEVIPYQGYLGWLQSLLMSVGQNFGSLATQKYRETFRWNQTSVAPIICYESVYGEFVGDYVQAGANLLAVVTNDGWWGNTPGHVQHVNMARLRAIEHHRSLAHCANTGTSGFIDVKGNISQATPYWEEAVISTKLPLYSNMTIYTIYGDYVGKYGMYVAFLLFGLTIFSPRIKVFRKSSSPAKKIARRAKIITAGT